MPIPLPLQDYVAIRNYIIGMIERENPNHWSWDTIEAMAEGRIHKLSRKHDSIEAIWKELQ